MSMADVVRQHREIDDAEQRVRRRFRVFKGIEANILADGTLDVQPRRARSVRVRRRVAALAAPAHGGSDRADAWRGAGRWCDDPRASARPHVQQPSGRGGGLGPRCSRKRRERRVAIELDGNWHRQDIDFELARRAMDAGCIFALDSDAHSIGELRFSDYAIAHARLAGDSREPGDQLLEQ